MRVSGVRQFLNERSLAILLENDYALTFKMYGRQANVILFKGENVTALFRHNFTTDSDLKRSDFDRTIDWSFEKFEKNQSNPSAQMF